MPDLSKTDWNVSERARKIHAEALVWDDHAGFEPDPKVDLEILEHWRAAGVDYLSVNVGYDVVPWQKTIKNIGAFITWLEKNADRFTLVRTVADIDAAKREGKLAIAFDIEGMNSLDGEAYMVSFYYRLGVRQMLFAYNLNNLAGSGCHDKDTGLTDFGRQVIAEMNRVGMIVDLAHINRKGFFDALARRPGPLLVSHTGVAGQRPHWRNIDDEQVRAVAQKGGVVGVIFAPRYLGGDGIERVCDHILHIIDVAGEDVPSLGSDFDGFVVPPIGLTDVAALPKLTAALSRRGLSRAALRKMLGENALRVLREVPPRVDFRTGRMRPR